MELEELLSCIIHRYIYTQILIGMARRGLNKVTDNLLQLRYRDGSMWVRTLSTKSNVVQSQSDRQ